MDGATTTEHAERHGHGGHRSQHRSAQARRRRNRLLPLVAVALVSFIAGVYFGAGSAEKDAADSFVRAWAKQDFAAMHDQLSASSAAKFPEQDFAGAYVTTQRTATATAIDPGKVSGPSEVNGETVVTAEVKVRTSIFGLIDGTLQLPFDGEKIAWEPHLTFPNLNPGERLGRRLELDARAAILAKDGTPLASGQGASRSSPLGTDAVDVVGEIGEPSVDQQGELQSEGYPTDVEVGVSGLERAFNKQLSGQPGGQLLAVKGEGGDVPAGTEGRVLATAQATPGKDVQTTIDPDLQKSAVSALGGRFGGVVVLDAKDGSVRALAGSGYSAPAPPGSTFKLITTTAALEDDVVNLSDTFEPTDAINVGGREIANSNDEICGGTFVDAFAESCNTVFAPLGPKIGEEKLVDTAEKYGFNEQPELANEEATRALDPPESSIPTSIGSELDLGVTAIGQGRVLATPLELASMAQTIAADGVRSPTSIVTDPKLRPTAKPVRVTDSNTAGIIRNLMIGVVNNGTGTAANMGKIQVAGKTGTAELGPKPDSEQPEEVRNPTPLQPGEQPPKPEQIIDAWFTCFAPAQDPKIVVAVFLADAEGDGGEVAAPTARAVLEAAL